MLFKDVFFIRISDRLHWVQCEHMKKLSGKKLTDVTVA